jgi:DNA polymerase-3 subunit delta'
MSWDRIRGHNTPKQTFRAAYDRGRLGQAYILVGPDGVGKRLFAKELTKSLLCDHPPAPFSACDSCPACAQVEAETHPDLHTLRIPKGRHEILVDDMRDFCAQLSRKPVRGGRKIGVVEDADRLNEESANSFLKTLEEPPPGVLLLLIAVSIDRQLPTIRSRCQVVRFGLLTTAELAAALTERGVVKPEQSEHIARMANGSMSRAMAIRDDTIRTVRDALITGIASERPNFTKLVEIWVEFVESAGDDSAEKRTRASVVVGLILGVVRQALFLAMGMKTAETGYAELPIVQSLARRYGPDRLLDLIEKCLEADYRIERRVQLILVIESLLEHFTRSPE